MNFEELLKNLLLIKTKAKNEGLNEKLIKNLKIVDVNNFNQVIEKKIIVELIKSSNSLEYYLLIKEKK